MDENKQGKYAIMSQSNKADLGLIFGTGVGGQRIYFWSFRLS
jgi:hypothetical protein